MEMSISPEPGLSMRMGLEISVENFGMDSKIYIPSLLTIMWSYVLIWRQRALTSNFPGHTKFSELQEHQTNTGLQLEGQVELLGRMQWPITTTRSFRLMIMTMTKDLEIVHMIVKEDGGTITAILQVSLNPTHHVLDLTVEHGFDGYLMASLLIDSAVLR